MKNVRLLVVVLAAVVAVVTLFVRVPLPSRGYFNFGDIAVVFAGLLVGATVPKERRWLGLIPGGLGSAVADLVGGYVIFAPLTFVAKGLEGGIAAYATGRSRTSQVVVLVCAGITMVSAYFFGEWVMPMVGLQGAIAELLPNSIQAAGGVIGGRAAFEAYRFMAKTSEASDDE